ncbi:MAG: histidine kinase [Bdellovibrionales bacterium]|nr:histidine kinase [Bdellovibrionales bacterium]
MENLKRLFSFSRSLNFWDNLKNYFRVVLVWCPIVTILFIFGFGGFDQFRLRFLISMSIATTVATFCFVGSWLTSYLYNTYRRGKGLKPRAEGLLWGALISYPFLLPGLYFGFQMAAKVSDLVGHKYTAPDFNDYSSGIIFGIMVSGLFTLFEVVKDSKEAKQAAELKFKMLENEKLKAQVSALSAQMNPHLLFNSLNTIASTITTDPKSAEDMVVKLSELYRGILKSAKGDMHSLENELLLCRSYLEIEQKRFGPRVQYNISVDQTLDAKKVLIPVLLLQPLVENTIKHGLSPKKEGGKVSIDIRQTPDHLLITVKDNGVGIDLNRPSNGTGTGLSNCQSRIRLRYGDAGQFRFFRNDQEETLVSISLPLKEALRD